MYCCTFVCNSVFQGTSVCGHKCQWPPTDVTSPTNFTNLFFIDDQKTVVLFHRSVMLLYASHYCYVQCSVVHQLSEGTNASDLQRIPHHCLQYSALDRRLQPILLWIDTSNQFWRNFIQCWIWKKAVSYEHHRFSFHHWSKASSSASTKLSNGKFSPF